MLELNEIFLKLFNMSISASWLVLAIVIFRFVLKKSPKWISCCMWALVGVRLVNPFSFQSILSLIPSAETVTSENFFYSQSPTITTGVQSFNHYVNPIISESFAPTPGASVNPTQILGFVLSSVWLIGMIVMFLYALISFLRLKRTVAASVNVKENIYVCDEVKSPFILGIIKPKIYIPSDMDEGIMNYVIAHETAHLKRKDYLWKPIGFILLSVYWFNPILWLSYILLCRDIELACDEKVIKDMEIFDKKAYSEALFSCSATQKMITACPVAFGEVGVKQRIKSVLNYKKPAFWVVFVAVVASVAIGVCFMTDPMEEENVTTVQSVTDFSSLKQGDFTAESILTDVDSVSVELCKDAVIIFESDKEEDVADIKNIFTELRLNDGYYSHPSAEALEELAEYEFKFSFSNSKKDIAVRFDKNIEQMWFLFDDDRYTSTFGVINGEIIKDVIDEILTVVSNPQRVDCYDNDYFIWLYNPMAGGTWWYETTFTVPEGYEIVSADATSGSASVESLYYGESDGEKCVKWSPYMNEKVANDEDTQLNIRLEKDGEEFDLIVKISLFAVETDGVREYSIEPVNCNITEKGTANYEISPVPIEELDTAVSQAILQINSGKNLLGECPTEGHVILGKKDRGNVTDVYVLERFSTYGFENGWFISKSGHSTACVMTFINSDGGYVFQNVEYTEDGSKFDDSVKRLFPARFRKRVLNPTDADSKSMDEQCRKYAEAYLKEKGRSEKIGDYGDVERISLTDLGVSVEASNRILEQKGSTSYCHIGYYEELQDGVRYLCRTAYSETENIVVFIKESYDSGQIAQLTVFDSLTGEIISDEQPVNMGYFDGKVLSVNERGKYAVVEPLKHSKLSETAEKVYVSLDFDSKVKIPDLYDGICVTVFYEGKVASSGSKTSSIDGTSAIYLYADINYKGNPTLKTPTQEYTTKSVIA